MLTTSSIDDLESLKSYLLSVSSEEFKALNNAYHYYTVTSMLRSNGRLNVILGGLTLWAGLTGFNQSIFHVIQAIGGLIILGQSLWALMQPTVPAILRFSFVFLLAGVWNLFLALRDSFQGGAFLVGLLGIAQIFWAYQFYEIYKRYQSMILVEPSADTAERYSQIRKTVTRKNIKDEAIITLPLRGRKWRCLFTGDKAALAPENGKLVIVTNEPNLVLEPENPKMIAKRQFPVILKADNFVATGKIWRSEYEKYSEWKGKEHLTPVPELARVRRVRRTIWFIEFGVLVLIGLFVTFMILTLVPYF